MPRAVRASCPTPTNGPPLRLVSFLRSANGDTPRFGALVGDEILDASSETAGLPQPEPYLDWFDTTSPAHAALIALVATAESDAITLRSQGALIARASVQLLAPVPRSRKVVCIGLNYRDHAEESGMDIPTSPLVFSKFSTCVVGPGADVRIPPGSVEVDYEAEFGVVIGRRASRVSTGDAMDYVLGYTNINDVSARDFQFADGQWQRGKSCDTFCPMGETIVTRDEIANPHSLQIQFRLNGETLQNSSTDQLIFQVPELISSLSSFTTLEPGDVIATGTPSGVGFARKPPVYIRPGDVMEVEIEGLGILANPVVA